MRIAVMKEEFLNKRHCGSIGRNMKRWNIEESQQGRA
jgi:hypothetical protein